MRIAYLSSQKTVKALSAKQNILEDAYLKDIKLSYNKYKVKLDQLEISREEFIKQMKLRMGI